MANWILDFFKKFASESEKETSVTINIDKIDVEDGDVTIKPKVKIKETEKDKKAQLSFQLGDLVNIKLDPENKAIYLEDQDSKPGDIDLLLYYLKPQIDGHQIIETPHVEVQLDETRKATDEELSAAKSAHEQYKKDLQDYKDNFKKKDASSHDLSEKEMLEMTISLLEDEIKRERDHERLKSLQEDLQHSKMHLQTMASVDIKIGDRVVQSIPLSKYKGQIGIVKSINFNGVFEVEYDDGGSSWYTARDLVKSASLNKTAGDMGFNNSDSMWYRVWIDDSALKYDDKVEAIVKSKDSDSEKRKKITERAKEIADENLHKADQLVSENNLGVQFFHLWAGELYMDRIDWDGLLHPDNYETESSLKRTEQLLDEYSTATPERKEIIAQQLKELKASLNLTSLFKDWWHKYQDEPALKEAYKKYSEQVKAADIPVPEYKDWAKEQYNELAGFTPKAAERTPETEKNIDKAQSLLLKMISDGFKTDSLMNLFQYVALKTNLSPEAIMDMYDELLTNGRIVEQLDKVMVRSASLIVVSTIVKRKKGYYVLSEKGKNLGGPYKSKSKAQKRLRQVEYFKHKADLLSQFEMISRTAKTEEEAEAMRTQILELHASDEQYPLDKEIRELVNIIDQLSIDDQEVSSQIGPDRIVELQGIGKVFKDYLEPTDTFIPSRMVIENLERANEILGL